MKPICKHCGKEIDRKNILNGQRHHAKCMIKMINKLRQKGSVEK